MVNGFKKIDLGGKIDITMGKKNITGFKPIDLGMQLPTVKVIESKPTKVKPMKLISNKRVKFRRASSNLKGAPQTNISAMNVNAGKSFDTMGAFKGGLIQTGKGAGQINISKEDIAKLRAGFKKFTSGGESLGKSLRKGGGSRTRFSRDPLRSESTKGEEAALKRRLADLKNPKIPKATPAQSVVSNIRMRLGLN